MEGFKDIVDHNERLTKRYADLVERMAARRPPAAPPSPRSAGAAVAARRGPRARAADAADGRVRALFGSYASNVAILVRDLMHARMVARHLLRRRRASAPTAAAARVPEARAAFGREPTRTMHNMVEVMRGTIGTRFKRCELTQRIFSIVLARRGAHAAQPCAGVAAAARVLVGGGAEDGGGVEPTRARYLELVGRHPAVELLLRHGAHAAAIAAGAAAWRRRTALAAQPATRQAPTTRRSHASCSTADIRATVG